MPNTPLNKEELRNSVAILISGSAMPSSRSLKKADAVIELLSADRDAAVREARKQDWWVTTGLKQNGKKLLGPFATRDLALSVRTYMEIAEVPATYWVEQSQPNAKEALGMKIEVSDKVPENGIRFDHPDGGSQGFILGNAKEGE